MDPKQRFTEVTGTIHLVGPAHVVDVHIKGVSPPADVREIGAYIGKRAGEAIMGVTQDEVEGLQRQVGELTATIQQLKMEMQAKQAKDHGQKAARE